MSRLKAYISCPMSVDSRLLKDVAAYINTYNIDTTYWEKGSVYSDKERSNIIASDMFIIILENNKFKEKFSVLTRGSASELLLAVKYKKPVFLAYTSMQGIKIYPVKITMEGFNITSIEGVPNNHNFISEIGRSDNPEILLNTAKTIMGIYHNKPEVGRLEEIYNKRIELEKEELRNRELIKSTEFVKRYGLPDMELKSFKRAENQLPIEKLENRIKEILEEERRILLFF